MPDGGPGHRRLVFWSGSRFRQTGLVSSDGSAPTTELHEVRTGDGAELAVWSAGSRDGECVVLVHGFSLDHTTWQPVADRLVVAGYRVVAPDLRGHGKSTLGSSQPTSDRFLQDLAAIATQLDVPRFHLVGHSLGAVIALAARVDEESSQRIISIVAVAGTEQSIQNPVMRLGARLFSSALGVALLKRERTGRLMMSTWFGKHPDPEQLDWIRILSATCTTDTRKRTARATGNVDLRPSFATSGPSTLIMVGKLDKATPAKVSRRIADAIHDAELTVVENVGHMVIIEQPDTVAERLSAWFAHRA